MRRERDQFIVKEKSDGEMRGHLGLHDDLPPGKEFPVVPPDGEIWVNDKLPKARQRQIVKHEKLENYLMREKHMSYKQAHKVAQKWEKL